MFAILYKPELFLMYKCKYLKGPSCVVPQHENSKQREKKVDDEKYCNYVYYEPSVCFYSMVILRDSEFKVAEYKCCTPYIQGTLIRLSVGMNCKCISQHN